jgi:primosomal protein N'
MESRAQLECLSCGHVRKDGNECPRCHYVGWALVEDLNERVRRLLRERPLDRRRLHTV